MAWNTPKTNWISKSKFNIEDFNRIKNNISYLYEKALGVVGYFEIEDMGSDITEYTAYWNVKYFNAIENNLLSIASKVNTIDYGPYQTFYENGAFIGYEELNRIEKTCAGLKSSIENQARMVRKIPFTLGRYREERF